MKIFGKDNYPGAGVQHDPDEPMGSYWSSEPLMGNSVYPIDPDVDTSDPDAVKAALEQGKLDDTERRERAKRYLGQGTLAQDLEEARNRKQAQ